jgi:glycosyltransferase involved in cell wall biosynthesis
MAKIITSIIETLSVIGAVAFALLWVRDPTGPYEPLLALLAALAAGLEFLRRYLRSSQLRVFLSVGATYTKDQEDYVNAFERLLDNHNIKRLVVGRDKPPARQPVLEVKDLMRKADAVVVLAFTRYVIHSGTEKPGANRPKHKQDTITDERHPTVWNQIEAGIAFGLGVPILLIIEEGMKQEAMLKDRLEFRAITAPLDPSFFETLQFRSQFADFTKIARRRSLFRL